MKPSIVKLENPIQHYAWGSREAIAMLQGRPSPSPEPEAELWVGDHPVAPSRVLEDAARLALPDWIARAPDAVLGPGRRQLPFLVKILAARVSLSVQVHPDAEQAAAGFSRESSSETPLTRRSYRDANAKHEVLVALSRFEALCGFRGDEDLARLAACVPGGRLAALVAETSGRAASLFHRLQRLDESERRELLAELALFGARAASREARWTARLIGEHPGDPLAAAPLLLNPVVLTPGSALIVRPGTVHTYLSGTGVEVMTPSDNVVRGGLTRKHVDPDELRVVARPDPAPPETAEPVSDPTFPGSVTYATGCADFSLRRLDPGVLTRTLERPGGRVAVVLCIEGTVELNAHGSAATAVVALSGGEAALVPATLEGYRLRGSGRTNRVFEVRAG